MSTVSMASFRLTGFEQISIGASCESCADADATGNNQFTSPQDIITIPG